MNIVRKHLSRVKGGQLAAAAYPAKMLALMISDVPGDDPAYIGSGPTVGDASTAVDALDILQAWNVPVPTGVHAALANGGSIVPPDDIRLTSTQNQIYAAPAQSLAAAAEIAAQAGYDVRILGDSLEGEAREMANEQARLAMELAGNRKPADKPVVILSGGELTVTRRGNGVGGPNAEFCLALAIALRGALGIHAIACDTDGVDGAAEVAGAVIGPNTLEVAQTKGVDAHKALANNDAHNFFAAIESQVITGPTLTNVNDFRAILITN